MKPAGRLAFETYFCVLVAASNCYCPMGLAPQQQQRQTRLSAAPFSSLSRSEKKFDRDTPTSRRNLLQKTIPAAIGIAAAGLVDGSVTQYPVNLVANALETETIGKDPDCDDSTCLGVWDGLLADCPHGGSSRMPFGAGCTSSQDDTPGIFSEP
jgi:hypothetical protein